MFDENFSFLSPTPGPFSCASNDTVPSSPDPSPFSSRCPSPVLQPTHETTSLAFRQRDPRYNSRPSLAMLHVPRHPSITALTAEFDSHGLDSPSTLSSSSSSPYSNVSTPNTELDDLDEGYYVDPDTQNSSSCNNNMFDPSLWDLAMSADLNPTSYPSSDSRSPAASFALRRRQRQALVRLQCLAKRAPDLAMLVEECHPSSLPMSDTPRSKSTSSSGGGGGRTDRERSNSTGAGIVKRIPKMKKRVTR